LFQRHVASACNIDDHPSAGRNRLGGNAHVSQRTNHSTLADEHVATHRNVNAHAHADANSNAHVNEHASAARQNNQNRNQVQKQLDQRRTALDRLFAAGL
jgi:hypothetical protein